MSQDQKNFKTRSIGTRIICSLSKSLTLILFKQKSNFEDTKKNMELASNSVGGTNENLSRQERRRLERINRKNSKKRR